MLVNETTWAVVDLSPRQTHMMKKWREVQSGGTSPILALGAFMSVSGFATTLASGFMSIFERSSWTFTVIFGIVTTVSLLTVYVCSRPDARNKLREELHWTAKVFTDEDLAFRLLRPVLHRANKVPNGREYVSALMITMEKCRMQYGEDWHISNDKDARSAWQSLTMPGTDSPLNSLIGMFVCENDLRRNFEQVVASDRRKQIEQLRYAQRYHEERAVEHEKETANAINGLNKVEDAIIYQMSKLPS
jgi:hypothetical protein